MDINPFLDSCNLSKGGSQSYFFDVSSARTNMSRLFRHIKRGEHTLHHFGFLVKPFRAVAAWVAVAVSTQKERISLSVVPSQNSTTSPYRTDDIGRSRSCENDW